VIIKLQTIFDGPETDTDALAQLLIRLAGIIVWAISEHKDHACVIENGHLAWEKIRDESEYK